MKYIVPRLALVFALVFSMTGIYAHANSGPPTDDFECVVTAIWFEARGEPVIGQRWVFEVIRNRAELGYRGQSNYCDVIYDPKQFSYANRDSSIRPVPKNSTEEAILSGIRARVFQWMYVDAPIDISCGATHYLRYDIAWKVRWSRQALNRNSDEGLLPIAVIGDHWFFGPFTQCKWR